MTNYHDSIDNALSIYTPYGVLLRAHTTYPVVYMPSPVRSMYRTPVVGAHMLVCIYVGAGTYPHNRCPLWGVYRVYIGVMHPYA
jgi:hypothetical protein